MKVGFIGTGVIAEAIIVGMLRSNPDIEEVLVSARSREVSGRLARQFDAVRVCQSNQEIVDEADLLFLCVLPQQAQGVITELRFRPDQKVASVIATLTAETLLEWIDAPVKITRAIPLPSVAHHRGVTALYPANALLEELFSGMGTVITAPSLDAFDSYAVASSTMATYFGILETISEWMQSQGSDADGAKAYLDTLYLGLANTSAEAADFSLGQLRVGHATPGGLNEQVFKVFRDAGGKHALKEALNSVADRVRQARELERL